jgi:hypothetical protein
VETEKDDAVSDRTKNVSVLKGTERNMELNAAFQLLFMFSIAQFTTSGTESRILEKRFSQLSFQKESQRNSQGSTTSSVRPQGSEDRQSTDRDAVRAWTGQGKQANDAASALTEC